MTKTVLSTRYSVALGLLLLACLLPPASCSQEIGVPTGATRKPVALNQACAGTDKMTGLDANGAISCSADVSGGSPAWGSITGTLSSQADLKNALDGKEATANKGAANGYAGLDGSGKVPAAQLSPTSLSNAQSQLSGAVTMTTAGTFYDGPSIAAGSLPAGTWLLAATVTVKSANNTAQRVTCKLWDGSTAWTSAEAAAPSQGSGTPGYLDVAVVAIVSLNGSQAARVSCASTASSSVIQAAAGDNGAGNNASTLTAMRIQ